MSADPFGTADLRAAVLGTWRSSPARLREDANTEEDHARGYYRDRVLVDLAQNASDAAVRAGVPGRLLVRLEVDDDGLLLTVANTGAPLDAAGVAALASMRASAKRDETGLVGRFGVGFAAVRAVADEIEVRSATGSVGFTLAGTRAALADAPAALAAEVAR
ncbi:sacsin N-terminal ATP-binding-like domain-containing protein, partial [Cellulomonas citrea]|uniref:sacsin N-terminal ATP-binding-like domain-containing protein n=1 Tax=Cellulomonas citrea TaxID=1909423 RepID=UPI002E2E8135